MSALPFLRAPWFEWRRDALVPLRLGYAGWRNRVTRPDSPFGSRLSRSARCAGVPTSVLRILTGGDA